MNSRPKPLARAPPGGSPRALHIFNTLAPHTGVVLREAAEPPADGPGRLGREGRSILGGNHAMNADQVLATHGILRAAEVVQHAREAGLDLAAAATLLEKESSGGQNIFGHDNVKTNGIYQKGQLVTKEVFLRYKAARQRGEIGPQGVGPTQLTLPAFQDQADREGGCFDWTVNVKVGFGILAGHIRSN